MIKKITELRIVLNSTGKPAVHFSYFILHHPFTCNLKGYLICSTLLICSETADLFGMYIYTIWLHKHGAC